MDRLSRSKLLSISAEFRLGRFKPELVFEGPDTTAGTVKCFTFGEDLESIW
jgi:hypothetical protein